MKENTANTAHCMVCSSELIYSDTPVKVCCDYCGEQGEALIACPKGHYVCDVCHSASSLDLLEKLAQRVKGEAPEDILEELFLIPGLPAHGPEHHGMGALALLLAAGKAGAALSENAVQEAIRRSGKIPGGACGYMGACGAGTSVGVAVSIFLGATPLKGKERGLANRGTAAALVALADGEARCCKRALRLAVREGRGFFERELGVVFPAVVGEFQCRDMERNKECPGSSCPYLP